MSTNIYRVGTANMYDNALRNLGARQTSLTTLQENLTSGKRVVRASDDPVSAAQAERALNRLSRIQTEQRALETQRNAIAQGESSLGDAVNLIQNFRELVVSAGDASMTPNDRATVANQLQGLREQLVEVANRKDTNGIPLLSALGSALAPFLGPLSSSPDYIFQGLPGQTASNGVTGPGALDGASAFMFDPNRDGVYTAGVSSIPVGRQLTTTAITPTNKALVTGDNYTITFSAVGPGATTGTSTATYTITNTTTGAVSAPVVVPDYPTDKPVTISVPGIPGLSFDIKGNPANGDTVTLQPSQRRHHPPAAEPQHVQHAGQRHPRHPQRAQQQCGHPGGGTGPWKHGHRAGATAQHAGVRGRVAQPGGPHHRRPGQALHPAGRRPFAGRGSRYDQGHFRLPEPAGGI